MLFPHFPPISIILFFFLFFFFCYSFWYSLDPSKISVSAISPRSFYDLKSTMSHTLFLIHICGALYLCLFTLIFSVQYLSFAYVHLLNTQNTYKYRIQRTCFFFANIFCFIYIHRHLRNWRTLWVNMIFVLLPKRS